ncbi:uncharacterized protein LOC111456503 [Cucurbita moschata]|uniref:Uncharacterized protein LOC111456503 n=1 Tax=Cucurbita moschata TaxID=3662 RepID=A0A6J1GQ85_CUCMO|nr:uncharacterized protein LOC111456503 [Cucurbita moschata]
MELWHKMIFPVRRVWLTVSARVRARKSGAGLLKLHDDVETCGYEDVKVMWEMLRRSESELVRPTEAQATAVLESLCVVQPCCCSLLLHCNSCVRPSNQHSASSILRHLFGIFTVFSELTANACNGTELFTKLVQRNVKSLHTQSISSTLSRQTPFCK